MAPDDMTQEQLIDEHGKRLGVHAERLNLHDKRLDEHGRLLNEYGMSLYGDAKLNVKGLVATTDEINVSLNEVRKWRDDVVKTTATVVATIRIIAILLLVIAGGVWSPVLKAILQAIGG